VVEPDAVLEVADHVFDLGVAAVVGLQPDRGADTVGDEGVVVPGGKQLALVAEVAHPTHDEPVALVVGLGDLGHAGVGIGDVDPGGLGDRRDRVADWLGLADGDRVVHLVAPQRRDGLGRPEPRVHADGQLAGGTSAAHAGDELINESGHAAGGVGPAGPLAGVQHLTGSGAGGQQRVVAELAGVAVGGTLLVMAVDLHDGGVRVDCHRPIAGSGTGGPRPAKELFGEPVQLAGVAEGERAQERADRRWRQDPVAQHRGGGPTAQHVDIVDAVPTGEDPMHQGQQLGAGVGGTWPLAEVDELVGGLLDPQPLGQGGGQQQPRSGDRVGVVEGDVELVEGVGGLHRESALLIGDHGSSSRRHSPRSEGLSHNRISTISLPQRCTQAETPPSPRAGWLGSVRSVLRNTGISRVSRARALAAEG